MKLNLTNDIVIIMGLAITWYILYSLFVERTPKKIALNMAVLVVIFSPVIAKISCDIYATTSRMLFVIFANGKSGEVQLAYSPMRIKDTTDKHYCDSFTDEKGRKLTRFSVDDNYAYCGDFWGMRDDRVVFIPYIVRDEKTAIYWASPELKIIGPRPVFDKYELHGVPPNA